MNCRSTWRKRVGAAPPPTDQISEGAPLRYIGANGSAAASEQLTQRASGKTAGKQNRHQHEIRHAVTLHASTPAHETMHYSPHPT